MAYTSFLQAPTSSLLAPDATLIYVTTTTEISSPTAIIKHLQSQQKLLEKKSEKVLNAIDGGDGLCVETETTLLFKMGGGAYLPGIDDNLLDERTVTLPITHIVRFDTERKIKQIRLYWDQGTMLKQVEVIGRTGRNWPIREGKAQIDAVNKSLNAGGRTADVNGAASSASSALPTQHNKRESVSATRDPHASLNLFAPRNLEAEEQRVTFDGPKHATRAPMAPQSRDLSQILTGTDEPTPRGSNIRSPSPVKGDGVILKSGAGKHYTTNRLFDENDAPEAPKSPERKKTYAEKHNHFEFGDGEDAPPQPLQPTGGRGSRNQQTQINFADFESPLKVREKTRPDYERHWGAGVQEDDPESPVKRPVVHAPRPDAETHFDLTDQSPAPGEKAKPLQRQAGIGGESDNRTAARPNSRRADDFRAHYDITDESPAGTDKKAAPGGKARSDLDAHWSFDSPVREKQIYKTAGDGMGGRKGTGRTWGFGDDSDPEAIEDANVRASARSRGSR